jgi:hypothetical protein
VERADREVPEPEMEPDAALVEPVEDVMDRDAEQPMGVVKYQGFAFEVRKITKDDWAVLGFDHDTVTWDAANNWAVAQSEFDFLEPLQFHNIIECDPKFTVEVLD